MTILLGKSRNDAGSRDSKKDACQWRGETFIAPKMGDGVHGGCTGRTIEVGLRPSHISGEITYVPPRMKPLEGSESSS
jgi:hypothetical protein